MNNHRMCKMVFDTLSKSSIEKSTLGKADRVTFEYYLVDMNYITFIFERQEIITLVFQ